MKKPVVLLIILAALVGFAIFYEKGPLAKRAQGGSLAGVQRRELVLPELESTKVRNIRLTEGDKLVSLSLKDGRWIVAERKGYPASFEKVQRTVKTLAEMKIKNKSEVAPGVLGEVKLLAPGEASAERTGLKVELLDEQGAVLGSIIAGASTSTSGGASAASGNNMFGGPGEMRFVRVLNGSDKDTVWHVDDNLYDLSSDPKDWVDKAFLDVRNVKSAEITAPVAADSWKAERKDMSSPFALLNPAPGEELDTAKADGLTNVLSSATFVDVLPKEQTAEVLMKDAFKSKLVTEDGFTYEIAAIEKKEGAEPASDVSSRNYVIVKVSADVPKERKAPADEKPEDKEKNDKEFAAKKKSIEEKLAKEKAFENWVFEVSNYTVSVLLKKRSEILRDKNAPTPALEPPAAAISVPGVARPLLPEPGSTPKLPPPVQPPPPPPPPASTPPAVTPTPVPGAKSTESPATPPTNPPASESKPSEAKPAAPEAPKPPAESKPAPDPETPPAPKPDTESKPAPATEPKPPGEAKPPGQ